MESSLKYMNIVPEGVESIATIVLVTLLEMIRSEAITQLNNKDLNPILIGEGGKVNCQYPEEGAKLAEGTVVILKTEGQTSLPDFTGWSKKMVLSFKMLSGLDIRINGDGYVTSQSLSKGTIIGH